MCHFDCINKTDWYYPAFILWLQLKGVAIYTDLFLFTLANLTLFIILLVIMHQFLLTLNVNHFMSILLFGYFITSKFYFTKIRKYERNLPS